MPSRVVILISGRGSNMRALVEASLADGAAYRVVQVISDQPGAAGLLAARELGVESLAVPASGSIDRAAYDRQLADRIDGLEPGLIVLAGFMRILSAAFVERYRGRIINIHPSLLPRYPGMHTHRQVLAARDATHGATVHFVTAELDGGPRIVQARVPVEPDDDEGRLAARVQVQEHRIYPLAVNWYGQGRLQSRGDAAWLDGRPLVAPVVIDADSPLPG